MQSRLDDESIVVVDPELRAFVDEINRGLDDRFASQSKTIKNDLKIHFEKMEDLVKTLAEAYGGTLDSMKRQVDRNKADCDTRFEDHKAVLDNHQKRISTLEKNKVS